MSSRYDFIQRANAPYIESMYARYREDASSVPEEWAIFFAGFDLSSERGGPAVTSPRVAGLFALVMAYREFGHLIAQLDPLGTSATEHPLLELSGAGLSDSDLDQSAEGNPFLGEFSGTMRELVSVLRETYCGTLGVEYMNIPDRTQREWLQQQMERNHNHPVLSPEDRVRILRELLMADEFEQFLHVKYVGQKRFSIEGAATLIPMLEGLVEGASAIGIQQLTIGMPHRGRLNVLANVLSKPLDMIFSEFEIELCP